MLVNWGPNPTPSRRKIGPNLHQISLISYYCLSSAWHYDMNASRVLWLSALLILSLSISLPSATRPAAGRHPPPPPPPPTGIMSLATITVGNAPVSIQYADSNQEVYVANTGDGTLSVISSATDKVITTIDTSCNLYYPYQIEYNPANQEIYEPCTGAASTVSSGTLSQYPRQPIPLLQGYTLVAGARGWALSMPGRTMTSTTSAAARVLARLSTT